MSRRNFTRPTITLVVAVCVCGILSAVRSDMLVGQSSSLVGHVVDTSGQPLPGVTITAMDVAAGIARYATSGGDGGYRFDALPGGTYRVDFELPGFDLFRWNNVPVSGAATLNAATLSITALCECVSIPRTRIAERAGQVVADSGRPLPYARLEIVSPAGREVARADREGRFRVRVPINGTWPLTASDSGFRPVTQDVSGVVAAPVVFTLPRANGTGLPDGEQFARGCRCPGDLFVHPER
jgi:hypothetical protein